MRCQLTKEQQKEIYRRAKELYLILKNWRLVAERMHLEKDHLYTIRNRFKGDDNASNLQ